ncbi:MAG TPA: sugar ABC transporter permease [Mycobacteriales bacterium]|jgi:multiple sugar transport system permease protein|nr:sugar ABC transporter permease [Mycobacteriales bacterium]
MVSMDVRDQEPDAASAQPPARKRRRGGTERRPFWLLAPTTILLALIVIVPLGLAIWVSLLDLNQYTLRQWLGAPFVGIANYTEAITGGALGSSALHSLWISVAFSVLTTAIALPLGLLAALTVNAPFRGRGLVRSLYLIPYVLPSFVTALLWRLMFLDKGLAHRVLSDVGIGNANTYWLLGGHSFWALVITDVWASWAFIYILALAGLQTIPTELYEAADVDGTNWIQKLRHIAIPNLRGVLGLGLLLSMINHFNNFTLPYVMFGTPPPTDVTVLPVNVYITSFQIFRFGLGATMSIITLVVMLVPGYIYFRALKLGASAGEA